MGLALPFPWAQQTDLSGQGQGILCRGCGFQAPGTTVSAFLLSLQARAAVDVPFWAEEVRGRDHTATFFPCETQRLACKKLPMGTPLSRQWGLGARLSVEVLYCFAPNSLPPLGQTLLPVHGALGSSLGSFSQFLLRGRLFVCLELLMLFRISWKD